MQTASVSLFTPSELPERWTPSVARRIFEAQEESQLSLSAFAKHHGLALPRLYYWQRRLRALDAPDSEVPLRLVQLRVRSDDPSPSRPFELLLPSGLTIRVPPKFDAESLLHLLAALGEGGC